MRKAFLIWVLGIGSLLVGSAVGQDGSKSVFEKWKPKIEPAVERALQYLARVQNADGSFPERYGTSAGIPALATLLSNSSCKGFFSSTLTCFLV